MIIPILMYHSIGSSNNLSVSINNFDKQMSFMKKNNYKVALVHDWLNGMRGGEKVLENFCDIFPDADIYTLHSELGKISQKIKTNSCECEVCSKVRECLINYKSYEPNDQLAQKFKDSIQETCEKYKIYI